MDKDNLIEQHRYINVQIDWWPTIYDDFARVCDILGVDLFGDPAFSGFSSQGDGASFIGVYRAYGVNYKGALHENYSETAPEKIREYAPKDEELHRIADELCVLSRIYYPVFARIGRLSSQYYHSGSMDITTEPMHGDPDDWADEVQSVVDETMTLLMRALADWLYAQLEKEYDYLTSDEAVWEAIQANELDKEEV